MSDRRSIPALDAFVVLAEGRLRRAALDLVSRLRDGGWRADMDLGRRSVKFQFKVADRRAAATAIVVGDEWQDGKITVRDLGSGEQEQITVEEMERWLQSR
jgi:histidyl-tRNA synthetase